MLGKTIFLGIWAISCVLASPLPSSEDPELLLNQGTNTAAGQFPYAVGLEIVNNVFCVGSILNEYHVLTAAACVINNSTNFLLPPNLVNVMSGEGIVANIFQTPRKPVAAIYIHPEYNSLTFENNLAVLRMRNPFPLVYAANSSLILEAAVEINPRIVGDTSTCQVVGWNTNTVNPPQQFLNVPVVNRDQCNGLAPHLNRIRNRMMCAGVTTAGPGVCLSDNGAGLYCGGRLTGILSSGFGCGVANSPGIYTQVRFYEQWINDQFNRQDIPQAGQVPSPVQMK